MIKRSTLRAQLAAALRDEILAGRLPAGSHFTVREIAEQYGVSATPVREALVDLAAQGLLDVEQHRGFRVHEFSAADYRSMVEARMLVLDSLFHGAAVLPLDPAVIASVRRRAEAAERAARAGDLDVLIGYDLRYWRELGECIGNPYIRGFLDRLRVQCWVFAVPGLRGEGGVAKGGVAKGLWAGHRELVDAVESRDAAAARRLIAAYHRHALELAEKPAEKPADGPAEPSAPLLP